MGIHGTSNQPAPKVRYSKDRDVAYRIGSRVGIVGSHGFSNEGMVVAVVAINQAYFSRFTVIFAKILFWVSKQSAHPWFKSCDRPFSHKFWTCGLTSSHCFSTTCQKVHGCKMDFFLNTCSGRHVDIWYVLRFFLVVQDRGGVKNNTLFSISKARMDLPFQTSIPWSQMEPRIFNGEAEGGSVDLDEALEITGLQEPSGVLGSRIGGGDERKCWGGFFFVFRGNRVCVFRELAEERIRWIWQKRWRTAKLIRSYIFFAR